MSEPECKIVDSTRAHWRIEQTGAEYSMEPITLAAGSGVYHMQDYLTPEQADKIAGALKEHAAYAREREAAVEVAETGLARA